MSESNVKSVLMPERIEREMAVELRLRMSQMINSGTRKIFCDFAQVQFISEEGARELGAVGKLMTTLRGELGACSVSPQVLALMKETSIRSFFRIYDVQESILLIVLAELTACFDEYDNILDIKARLDGKETYVDIDLEFDGQKTMAQVQQTVNQLQKKLMKRIQNSHILIVPRAAG